MSSILSELKRRNVFKVAAVYAIISWLILQIADVAFPALQLPGWTITLVMVLLIIGFVLAMIFAWAFELTPEGLKREADVDRSQSITPQTGQRLNYTIVGLLLIALGVSLYFNLMDREPAQLEAETAAEIEKSIAVLPFVNMSGDPDNEYFSDGLTDTLLHMLAQVDELKVAARTSSFAFKGKNEDIRIIGQQLGVGAILEGSVQKSGDRLRIITQLVEVGEGTHLWSETFDRRNEDIFDIQDEIATQVVDALRVSLLGEQAQRLTKRHTDNLDAYDQYMLGRQSVARRTNPEILKALTHFQKAVGIDPGYALAWVAVSDAALLANTYGSMGFDETVTIASQAIDRAFELDDQLGEAYTSRAYLRLYDLPVDLYAVLADHQKGIELSPNHVRGYQWYGNALRRAGQLDKALTNIKKAVELDPLSAVVNVSLADTYEILGRYEEALQVNDRVMQMEPDFPNAYRSNAVIHMFRYSDFLTAARLLQKAWDLDARNIALMSEICALWDSLEGRERMTQWCTITVESALMAGWGTGLRLAVASELENAEELRSFDDAQIATIQFPRTRYMAMRLLRDQRIKDRDYAGARALYENYMSDGFLAVNPVLGIAEVMPAIDYGLLMINAGRFDRANAYLDKAETVIRDYGNPHGFFGHGFAEAELYAVRGKNDLAIATLQRLIDDKVRWEWQSLDRNMNLVTLHNDNRFVIMLNMLRADIQKQRREIIEEGLLLSPE